MDIFSVISLLGGLALFLFGMNVLSSSLEKMAGGKLENVLRKITSNPFKSLLLGAGITAAIQSSSAVTVMLVGLVNSGIMQLGQTVGVIMGSNVGTTMTAWILSLTGIESDNVFINLLKPSSFSPIIAFIGVLFIMMSKNQKKKDIGTIMVAFAILMYGMNFMSGAVEPLAESESFTSILTAFENPLLGVAFGAIFTAIIQSSSASVGVLQALSMTGSISFGMAIPIIMGQNIGTCITSVISSIGVNKNAKRVAVVHITFNLIGAAICLVLFYGLYWIFNFAFVDEAIEPVTVALCHTVFNIVTTAILFPFNKKLVGLAEKIIKDKSGKEKYTFLDERLLNTPSFAISECVNLSTEMAQMTAQNIKNSITLFKKYDKNLAKEIVDHEKIIDRYEDKLGTFLVKISGKELSVSDSKKVASLLHSIGDFERISDHARNVVRVAEEMKEKHLTFSKKAMSELQVLFSALDKIIDLTFNSFINQDLESAKMVEPLEEVIDTIRAKLKNRHIARLQKGTCTIELGFIYSDLLTNLERVSDHCSNIAACMLQIDEGEFEIETHEYLKGIKENDEQFKKEYAHFIDEYKLPKSKLK